RRDGLQGASPVSGRPSSLARGADGFVATELVLAVALLLVPVALLVLTLPTWSERRTTGRVIAREVARTTAREGVCDVVRAKVVADTMARNLGMTPGDLGIELDCNPGTALDPGGAVAAIVTVHMPAVALPGIGAIGDWSWTAAHRQPVDRYASLP